MQRLYRLGFCGKEVIEQLKYMRKPRQNKKEYPSISTSKIRTLLSFIKTDKIDYYYPIYFMCRTGRRVNETTLIERKDIIWDGIKPIRINVRAETTKTKQYAPLTNFDNGIEQVVIDSNRASIKQGSRYLFSNRLGRKCTPDKLREYLKKMSRKVIGVAITPHYFRHRFLTECGKANVPMVDVMAVAGIKDIEVVIKHYSHSTDKGLTQVFGASRFDNGGRES